MLELLMLPELIPENENKSGILIPIQDVLLVVMLRHKNVARNSK